MMRARFGAGAGVCGAALCALLAGCGGGGGGTVSQVPTITGVSVSVASSSITSGKTDQASDIVSGTGAYTTTVSWSVSPSSIGSINSGGLFTAGASATGTATITATSTEDATKSGTATVKVTAPAVTVSVTPATATIGAATQFTATASDGSTPTWDWTLTDSTGGTTDAGTISSTGLYQSPYPPPSPATVIVTATSAADSTVSGSATVTLAAPATTAGPILTVDLGNPLHPISPYIYGANGWQLDTASAAIANFSLLRWGGDATSRYNYKLNSTNSASDWYFENFTGQNGAFPTPGTTAAFTDFVTATDAAGMAALGTVPVQGWVSNSNTNNNSGNSPACSFPQSSYPNQVSYDGTCGNGVCQAGKTCGYLTCPSSSTGGCSLFGAAATPAITSVQEPPPSCTITQQTTCANGVANCMVQTCTEAALPTTSQLTASWAQGNWTGGWVDSFVTNASYGKGSTGKGVAIWDLDNEPAWWDAVHRDVHPDPSTYDEVTLGGIGTALAIKTADPTALVSGPIIDFWWNYFYSKQDIEAGWGTGPCYQPWASPNDRVVHHGAAMIPYYLEQMQQSERSYGFRLLDYLDIHGYFAGSYNGNSVAFTTAGDTGEQKARMDSVRALWDPTYTSPNYPQPNYITDPNHTSSCNLPLQAPEAVPMLEQWVNGVGPRGDPNYNYPGTKTAIDEYNFGALESINGAVTQADVLGVFGQYGLDLATLWPTSQYTQQGPGNYAFAMYRNYDGKNSTFGDKALASCSTQAALTGSCTPVDKNYQPVANMENGQGQLSVYGALRTKDNAVTVMVINKTYGPLTSTISLLSLPAPGTVTAYQYSNANLAAIVPVASGVTVTAAVSPATTSTLTYTFPAQSMTLFVIPQ
ncbi:MAG TPA: glycoside hydrolase family 44 protein [Acidobacteriaceae bacterium]